MDSETRRQLQELNSYVAKLLTTSYTFEINSDKWYVVQQGTGKTVVWGHHGSQKEVLDIFLKWLKTQTSLSERAVFTYGQKISRG